MIEMKHFSLYLACPVLLIQITVLTHELEAIMPIENGNDWVH